MCTVIALPAFARQRLTEAQFESIRLSKIVTAFIVKVTNLFNF